MMVHWRLLLAAGGSAKSEGRLAGREAVDTYQPGVGASFEQLLACDTAAQTIRSFRRTQRMDVHVMIQFFVFFYHKKSTNEPQESFQAGPEFFPDGLYARLGLGAAKSAAIGQLVSVRCDMQ
jgi:hypothetical protein